MKRHGRSLSVALALFLAACSRSAPKPTAPPLAASVRISAEHFQGMDGCALVYDLKLKRLLGVYGEQRCAQRFPACSTFKWPLALMAFDSGILQDEGSPMKWDGIRRAFDSWNQDQTAVTWMKYSVVWFSQRLTPQLGLPRIQDYLRKFAYGNQNFSAGLRSAWLTITKTDTDPGKGSLKINAYEQQRFVERFWAGELPVSRAAVEKTRRVLFQETTPAGYQLYGKTGSGYRDGLHGDFGWFVGLLEGQGSAYAVVTTFTREERAADARLPGLLAREITKGILEENHLW